MLCIVGLVLLLSVGLYVLPPIAIAVGLMVGYRAVYLLSNLEFWGLSALVFDVRQSKRIFGIIGSGDLPAKAIGALLAVLIHSAYSLYILLWIACVAFLLAYLVQVLTFRFTEIPDHHKIKPRIPSESQPKLIDKLFGGSWLVFYLCVGLVFISAAAIFIEYSFFFNVKHKYHEQGDVMNYIGFLLCITFGIATLIKLLLSSRVIDRFGLRNILLLLPILSAIISITLYGFTFLNTDEIVLLNMFSGLYLLFEITRKTTYDPVFLVMFQPLFLHQRLKAHTLAKGFYEPIGIAITGTITLIAYFNHIHFEAGSFLFIFGFAMAGLFFLIKAYGYYLRELKNALGKRFFNQSDLVFKQNAEPILLKNLESEVPSDVLFSLDWYARNHPDVLTGHYASLLTHESQIVRKETLQTMIALGIEYDAGQLLHLVRQEPDPKTKPFYGSLACQSEGISESQVMEFLNSNDLAIVQGGIIGCKKSGRFSNLTHSTLSYLTSSEYPEDKLAALEIIGSLGDTEYQQFVEKCLASPNPTIVANALKVAPSLPTEAIITELQKIATHRTLGKPAIFALLKVGNKGLPAIYNLLETNSPRISHFVILACERLRTPQALALLLELLREKKRTFRQAVLKSLVRIDPSIENPSELQQLLQEEFDHIYFLLKGQKESLSSSMNDSLEFEINESVKNILSIFVLLYDSKMVENAMVNIEHSSREKRANAIEMLDNIIPRNEYQALHELLEEAEVDIKIQVFEKSVARTTAASSSILQYILEFGTDRFSEWTVAQAIQLIPEEDRSILLGWSVYANHLDPIIRDAYQKKTGRSYQATNTAMNKDATPNVVSPLEKVMVLKRTQLFANTPENVLSAVVPIIHEYTCHPGQILFEKGELGNCMYIIYSGTIDIYDGKTKLARFGSNDIFGELALLDAETRSASAVATEQTLLFKVDQEDFYDLMEERSELLKSVLSILCKRIRNQNDRLRKVEKLTEV